MKYPNKLYSVRESVVGKMMELAVLIPENGIGVEDLYYQTHREMSVSDFLDALSCMYMIGSVEVSESNIVRKIC
jgi:hypothetical protein